MSVPEGITALESAAREWQKDKVRLETANVQLERARLELESERMKLTEIIDQQRARISLLEKELAEYRTGARSDIVAATHDVSSSASPASPAQNSGDDLMPNVSTPPHASSLQTPDESSSQKAQKSKDKSSKRKSNKANKSKSKDKSGDPTSTTKKKRKVGSKSVSATDAEAAVAAAEAAAAPATPTVAASDQVTKSASAPVTAASLGPALRVPALDRSNKQLTEIPDEIWPREEFLQKLHLFKNAIKTIPDKIRCLQQLQILDLNNNSISGLPEAITALAKLRELLLADNMITQIPSLANMSALTRIDLSSNNLSSLPEAICDAPCLTNLNLAFNNFTSLPDSISKLQTLELLRLNNNKLTSLSAALGKLPALQSLEVRSNEITSVADEIGSLQMLSYFDLAFNNLSNMPNAFKAPACQMTALAYLDLSHNKIQPIPADFFEDTVLDALEGLLLGHNELDAIPIGLGNLTQLDLKNNKIAVIAPEISDMGYLNVLDLAGNKISELPSEFLSLNSLQTLNLFGNLLKELPSLSDLMYLNVLNVGFNDLSEIDLNGLESLDELVISGNPKIASLPDDLDSLCPSLRVLYASGCSIGELPESICQISTVEQIDLSFNKLKTIPATIRMLESLQVFNVSHNEIVNSSERATTTEPEYDLPWDCCDIWDELSGLHELDFGHNKMEYVPLGLEALRAEIILEGNPLKSGQKQPSSVAKLHVYHSGTRFDVGWAEMVGRRGEMEDRFCIRGSLNADTDLFCVFDGHAGRLVADFAAEVAPEIVTSKLSAGVDPKEIVKDLFNEINAKFKERVGSKSRDTLTKTCGATAIVALIIKSIAYIANVGDARVVSSKGVALTVDHKPRLEQDRIRALPGGYVTGDGYGRINGLLAVSRSLGDFYMHPWVIADPYIHVFDMAKDESKFLILACDGVWDEVPSETAAQIVTASLASPHLAARRLRDTAYAFGSDDNISVMIVKVK